MKNIVVGIEGLVGSGKTSICKQLIKILPNTILFNGGNLYRGIIYAFTKENNSINNLENIDIITIMEKLKVRIEIENNETVVYINNTKIDEETLQSDKNSIAVSQAANIANNNHLFIYARKIIDKFKEKYNVIISGRALMEIYPNLNYHFFITADIDERVKRKSTQYKGTIDLTTLKEHIEQRDQLQEQSGFYKIYPNTIKIDVTNCKSVIDSTEIVCSYIKELYSTIS